MMRSIVLVLAAFGLEVALFGREAFTDPPAVEASAIERAFATGDLAARRGDAVETTDELARAFAWIRDSYWRAGPSVLRRPRSWPDERVLAYAVRLTSRAEKMEASPGADPLAADVDPMPIVTALVEDRIRRESTGLHSTRSDGPLARVASSNDIAVFLDDWVPGGYGGPSVFRNQDRAAAQAFAARVRRDATRNAWCAAGALSGLVLLAVLGGMGIGRWRVCKPGATGACAAKEARPS